MTTGKTFYEAINFEEHLIYVARVDHRGGVYKKEPRFFALGQTDGARLLFIVFAIRGKLIRVISARDMNRRERKQYEEL